MVVLFSLVDFMDMKVLFVVFSWLLSLFVVFARSAIHSILGLILLFIITALIFIGFFGLYFIGVLLIIVYIGAVTVLFLFIVIMIPLKEVKFDVNSKLSWFSIFGAVVMLALVIGVCYILLLNNSNCYVSVFELPTFDVTFVNCNLWNDLQVISQTIYYKYSFALVVAALLLFVALVIAIILCLN